MKEKVYSQWRLVWHHYVRTRFGLVALVIFAIFVLVGLYAPFLASSKPIMVQYNGHWFFPLFRYIFYSGFYSKGIDLFYNVLMFLFPLFVLSFCIFRPPWRMRIIWLLIAVQFGFSFYCMFSTPKDPAASPNIATLTRPTWSEQVKEVSEYGRLNMVLRYKHRLEQHHRFVRYQDRLGEGVALPTLFQMGVENRQRDIARLERQAKLGGKEGLGAQHRLEYLLDKHAWLEKQQQLVGFEWMPLIRPFHWQEDAGGQQQLNRHVDWWDLTRINRKDLVASLIFGVRISLAVGITAVVLSLIIGIPLGSWAGYYGGATDIVLSRFIEIWEAMPTFFMLLMIVALLQSKSVFLVITILGFFGWTGFSRFLRGEVLKQRGLAYVEACRSQGLGSARIMFRHILPNAIPPLLTLLPFSVMAAITAEAGLSFLGLGEEGSSSWGVLMDEGRSAFPAESYLLWPPAIMLTVLLIAIALVGDSLRDALDPKMRR